MLNSFEGIQYRLANNWVSFIDVNEFIGKPIKYLEIGTFYGANLLSIAKSYCYHSDSKLYCIDPWVYSSENNEPPLLNVYETFLRNVETSGDKDKITAIRGYSYEQVPSFENDFFDIIYIDGDHAAESVLEDAVISFRKLKVGGYMVFDDYGWGGPDLTQRGIDAFLSGYKTKIKILGENNTQVFIQKISK